jgi:NAD-dependent SIR2 family protein deacetylase
MEAITVTISGIQCDNPSCDFKDETVSMADYEYWLNKPCPKCGNNLLTEADLLAVKKIRQMTVLFNEVLPGVSDDGLKAQLPIHMNGTGSVEFGEVSIDED